MLIKSLIKFSSKSVHNVLNNTANKRTDKNLFFFVWHFLSTHGRMSPCLFQHTYSKDDCTFREHILPDGYNIYISDTQGALLSLGNQRQRLQGRDRGVPALAQFLPRISTLDQAAFAPGWDTPEQPEHSTAQTEQPVDAMDSFGKLSQIIHSPSFHKRWDSGSSETPVNTSALSETKHSPLHVAELEKGCMSSCRTPGGVSVKSSQIWPNTTQQVQCPTEWSMTPVRV